MIDRIDTSGFSARGESLIEKLSQKSLFYRNLAAKAKHTPGMEEVASHYAEHALRFDNAVSLIRSGRSREAAGALTEDAGEGGDMAANQAAAERAAARRRRMMELAR